MAFLTPIEGSKTAASREYRCAQWLRLLLKASENRKHFGMTAKGSPTDGSMLRLISSRGVELCRVPRATFRSWVTRVWIERIGLGPHGELWLVTDAGREAAR